MKTRFMIILLPGAILVSRRSTGNCKLDQDRIWSQVPSLPHIFCDTWHVWQGTWLREGWRSLYWWSISGRLSISRPDVARPCPGVSAHLASVAWPHITSASGHNWLTDILTCVWLSTTVNWDNVYFEENHSNYNWNSAFIMVFFQKGSWKELESFVSHTLPLVSSWSIDSEICSIAIASCLKM